MSFARKVTGCAKCGSGYIEVLPDGRVKCKACGVITTGEVCLSARRESGYGKLTGSSSTR
jgi:hypothetical protein